jgi:hypothetical protein
MLRNAASNLSVADEAIRSPANSFDDRRAQAVLADQNCDDDDAAFDHHLRVLRNAH